MRQASLRMERVALKWRALAERRRAHFLDLYRSSRWKHYYTDEEFLDEMRAAIAIAERWAQIAPRPEELELEQPAELEPAESVALRSAA